MKKFKYNVAISGASDVEICTDGTKEKAFELGQELARNKCVVISGATKGIPHKVSRGNREAGGINVGFSPAVTRAAHTKCYKLPSEPYDIIIFTGADYAGRDIVMTKAAEAMIIISGSTGTMHEFLTAFETGKIIGVLEGTGGIADEIRHFLKVARKRAKAPILYHKEPKELVKLVVAELQKNDKLN